LKLRSLTSPSLSVALAVLAAPLVAQAPSRAPRAPATASARGAPAAAAARTPAAAPAFERPIPYPVVPPPEYRRAVEKGTRATTGRPGPNYWQQYARYRIGARLDVDAKTLAGSTHVVYLNHSPDTLRSVWMQVEQNFHTVEAPRLDAAEITGGMQFTRVAADGQVVPPLLAGPAMAAPPRPGQALYRVDATRMQIRLPRPLLPHDSVALDFDWSFHIPADGVDGRMGWNAGNLFYLAYWYPQMAVYDDVVGWQTDPFLGSGEFYDGFAEYDVTLDVPEGWLVTGTGRLLNAAEVFPDAILERIRAVEASDTVVHILTSEDLGPGKTTRPSADGRVRWHFAADSVRDVAYGVTSASLWDAVRTDVGDRDGDGRPDFARAEAIYRSGHTLWKEAARDAQRSIAFLSRYTGVPYPWPHATAVEGSGIIGGGMEYPMMTLIGGYDGGAARDMFGVIAHELAHEWVPMIVNTDERRYGWMDEGTTTFNEEQATREMYPGTGSDLQDFQEYIQFAKTGQEGEMMRWSDYQYNGMQYGVASYAKPASVLEALRTLMGTEAFDRAYQGYLRTWRLRHPLPWDFFDWFSAAAGQDLSWFWRSWYYETWTLDQSVGSVRATPQGTEIVVRDVGDVPMPARLTITLADGSTLTREVPVSTWLAGRREATVTVPRGRTVTRVEIDAEHGFPDVDRANNVWVKP